MLLETANSHETSKKQLFAATARMAQLHSQVTTTYVNLTLIQEDALIGAEKAAVYTAACAASAQEAAAPYWARFMDVVEPISDDILAWYKRTMLPPLKKASAEASKAYDEHIKPVLKEHVLPVLQPVLNSIRVHVSKLHVMAVNGLQHTSKSLLAYLELVEAKESFFYRKLVTFLEFVSQNSAQVWNSIIKAFLILFVLRSVWPRRKKKDELEPKIRVGQASPRKKGIRVRSNRRAAPTQ